MATWQGVNVNTGTPELPKDNATGTTAEIYIAALTTAATTGDVILGPVIQAGQFIVDIVAAPDDMDSGTALVFGVGYINSGGTSAAAFIAAGNTTGQTGGVVHANVPTAIGQTFTVDTTVVATIGTGAGTAVAGNFRLMSLTTSSP